MIFIHHGPGVENALRDLLDDYTLVQPPYEDLKTDRVKDLVHQMSQVWPQNNPALVAGPLDEVLNTDVLDILLKRIEEPYPNGPSLILWARDLGSVPPTIRSRCGERYHFTLPSRHDLYDKGKSLLSALRSRDALSMLSLIKTLEKGKESDLVRAYLEVLIDEDAVMDFYDEDLRDLLKGRSSVSRVTSYFLEKILCR